MKLYVFGDSISFGQYVSGHLNWVTRLALEAHDTLGPGSLSVINQSVNGSTTRQALERMPYDIQSQDVDFLVVQFGLNDCNKWDSDLGLPRVSPRAFEANIAEIVTRAERHGAKRVFVNTNHVTAVSATREESKPGYDVMNREYNQLIRKAVSGLASPRVHLLDVETAWLSAIAKGVSLRELLLEDGLHLSEAGHRLYLDTIGNSILRQIQKALP